MALIVGDDFQHILRVLNTNVDGREKVRRRFRFLLVREWAFGVRMRSSSRAQNRIPGRRSPFGIARVSFGSNRISRRVGKMERDSRARRFLARWEYLRARMRLVRAVWMLATRAKRRKKRCHSFVFFSKHTQKGESFYNPTRGVSCSSSKTFCVLTTRQTRFLFSSRNRSCTLSRKSKASVVDLPTSSAKRQKSIWVKELGNSPLLNSNR